MKDKILKNAWPLILLLKFMLFVTPATIVLTLIMGQFGASAFLASLVVLILVWIPGIIWMFWNTYKIIKNSK